MTVYGNFQLRFILATSIFVAGFPTVETGAVDYPLTTDTKVDYNELKSGFANPPEESKLWCFWFWQYGLATKESITQDIEAMRAKGYGGALLGDNWGPEGQVGPVFEQRMEGKLCPCGKGGRPTGPGVEFQYPERVG